MTTIVQECVRGELGAQSDCWHPRFSITPVLMRPSPANLRTGECVGSFGLPALSYWPQPQVEPKLMGAAARRLERRWEVRDAE
jgi:hypothetical protein